MPMQRKANTGKERETRRPADAGKERDKTQRKDDTVNVATIFK